MSVSDGGIFDLPDRHFKNSCSRSLKIYCVMQMISTTWAILKRILFYGPFGVHVLISRLRLNSIRSCRVWAQLQKVRYRKGLFILCSMTMKWLSDRITCIDCEQIRISFRKSLWQNYFSTFLTDMSTNTSACSFLDSTLMFVSSARRLSQFIVSLNAKSAKFDRCSFRDERRISNSLKRVDLAGW